MLWFWWFAFRLDFVCFVFKYVLYLFWWIILLFFYVMDCKHEILIIRNFYYGFALFKSFRFFLHINIFVLKFRVRTKYFRQFWKYLLAQLNIRKLIFISKFGMLNFIKFKYKWFRIWNGQYFIIQLFIFVFCV